MAAAPIFAPDGGRVEAVVLACQDVSALHELAQGERSLLVGGGARAAHAADRAARDHAAHRDRSGRVRFARSARARARAHSPSDRAPGAARRAAARFGARAVGRAAAAARVGRSRRPVPRRRRHDGARRRSARARRRRRAGGRPLGSAAHRAGGDQPRFERGALQPGGQPRSSCACRPTAAARSCRCTITASASPRRSGDALHALFSRLECAAQPRGRPRARAAHRAGHRAPPRRLDSRRLARERWHHVHRRATAEARS